ncbi:MAG TPA: TonB-dependent receptor [Acidobacteriaceae bacterium]
MFAIRPRRVLALLAFATIALAPATIHAQSTTDGAIGGTVYDPAGAVVPNASIRIHNTQTNAEATATTDSNGFFRVIQLQPGGYDVTINASGFSLFKAQGTVVTVGALTNLSPHLTVGAEGQTVTVTGENPLVNTSTPEVSSVVDQRQIDNLPINGGRWSSFALLTPGVVSNSSGFGLLSFRGQSELLNNNTIDGADNNQAYFSEERGRTRLQYSTSEEAIREFQVNTSNYSSEYGRSAGGVINTVTKSGTNSLHGQAFFRDRDNDWGSLNDYTTLTTRNAAGAFVTNPYNPKDWRKQWGFGIGGPIIKNRLFWFYAYDQSRRNFPGVARVGTPNVFFAVPAASTSASACPTVAKSAANYQATLDACNLATRLMLANYDAGAALEQEGVSALNSGTLGGVPRTGEQVINFPKLDWVITQKHHASFEYNRLRWDSPAGIQTQSSNTYGVASFGNDYVKEDWGVATLESTLSATILNQARFQYGRDFEYESSQVPTAYESPFASNTFGRPAQITIDGSTGYQIGKPAFLERRAYPDERRIQVADTVTWLRGNHALKFGADYNRVLDYIGNLYNENGSYTYTTIGDYLSDYYHFTQGLGPANYIGNYSSYSQEFGPPAFQLTTNDYAFFVEDDWKIRPRLTLNLGVRYEYESIPGAILPDNLPALTLSGTSSRPDAGTPNVLPGYSESLKQLTSHSPDDKNNVGPRIGFAWDIHGDARSVLRGGYGVYYGRIVNSNILQTYVASGNTNGQTTYSGIKPSTNLGTAAAPQHLSFPNILTAAPGASSGSTTIAFFDKNFQAPTVQEMDLTLQQDVGWNTVFSLSYLGSLGRHLINGIDRNFNASTIVPIAYHVIGQAAGTQKGSRVGPLADGSTYNTSLYTGARPVAGYGAIVDVASNVNTSYHALAAQISHKFAREIQFDANYTWAKALDYNQYIGTGSPANNVVNPQNPNLRAEYGLSPNDVRNRFVANMVYSPTFQLSGWKNSLASGWGLSPIFQAQSGLPYTIGTSGTFGGDTALGIPAASLAGPLGSGVSRFPGLRNSYTYPRTFILDARLSKRIPFGDKYSFELFGEMFNSLNHQNVTGVATTGYTISDTSAGPTLTYQSNFGSVQNSNSNYIYSPRQVQVAARFNF